MKKFYDCFISLGSNLGDRAEYIKKALMMLEASEKIQLVNVSSLYETPPWGKYDQPSFINGAACLRTDMPILELLHVCQDIELKLGRERHEHWGPRTIDIDLLWAEGTSVQSSELKLPHPYMQERAFVLIPLQEIAPALTVSGKSISYYLSQLPDADQVKPIAQQTRSLLEEELLEKKGDKVYD